MQIEPEALYGLFDTLFLPGKETIKNEKKAIEKPFNIRLLMLFDKEPTQEENDFLNKILLAINIKPKEVETNFEVNSESLSGILEKNSGYILIWGIDYKQMEKYKLIEKGEFSFIVSDDLNSVKNDQSLKAKLWNCLKEVFVK